MNTVLAKIQLRRGTAAEWSAANPVLALGELALEINTKNFKIGDGVTAWNSLAYGGIQGPQGSVSGSFGQLQFNAGGSFGAATGITTSNGSDLSVTGRFTVGGQAVLAYQSLTDAAGISWNANSGAKAKVVLGGNRIFNAVANAVEGTSYTLCIVQDGSGSRTVSWANSGAGSFDFGADGPPTLSTLANRADLLGFEAISVNGTLKLRFVGIRKGFS